MINSRSILAVAVLATGLLARADDLTIGISSVITGATPAGPSPWVVMDFSQQSSTSVRLDVISHLTSPNYLDTLTFNVANPVFAALSMSQISSGSGISFVKTLNGINAGPTHGFDLTLNFPNANADRFGQGSVESFLFTNPSGLNISDFGAYDPSGVWAASAHFAAVGNSSTWAGADSFVITRPPPPPTPQAVPEVGTVAGAATLALMTSARLLKRSKQSS